MKEKVFREYVSIILKLPCVFYVLMREYRKLLDDTNDSYSQLVRQENKH